MVRHPIELSLMACLTFAHQRVEAPSGVNTTVSCRRMWNLDRARACSKQRRDRRSLLRWMRLGSLDRDTFVRLDSKPVSKANVVLAHDGRGSITPSENTDECTVQLEVRRNPCGDQAGTGCRCLRAIPRGSSARVVPALGLTRFDRAPFLQMLPCPARRFRTQP